MEEKRDKDDSNVKVFTPPCNPANNSQRKTELVKVITNKVLDLIVVEINKDEMKDTIKNKVIHPMLYMIYCQIYPYIFTVVIIILLMFIILIILLVFFLLYLRKTWNTLKGISIQYRQDGHHIYQQDSKMGRAG